MKKKLELPTPPAGMFWRVGEGAVGTEYSYKRYVTLSLIEKYTTKSFFLRKPIKKERIVRHTQWDWSDFQSYSADDQTLYLYGAANRMMREFENVKFLKSIEGDYLF